jgi:Tfp pilus assembly protein PilO
MADAPKKTGPGGQGKASPGLRFSIKLTKQQQQNIAAAVIIIGGLLFVYFKYLLLPNIKTLNDRSAVLEQKKKDLRDARNMVSKYDEFLKNASDINFRTDFINRRLPAETNISDTIRELTKRATEYNIGIINFEPGAETNKGDYKQTEIKIHFLTTYNDLGNFITSMGYIERLTTPSDIVIKAYKPGTTDAASVVRENIGVDMSVQIYSFI